MDLQSRLESLQHKTKSFGGFAETNASVCLAALDSALSQKSPVFGIEPWHKVRDDVPLDHPGEMLLRLKNKDGTPLPPYPSVMAFYNNGCAAELDILLVLCALWQFGQGGEDQVSINISGESLRSADFIRAVLPAIEALHLKSPRKIIFEIHESSPTQLMSANVLGLCRKLGLGFAIDDVGLSMNDIFRLSEFEDIADFVKLDRKSVNAAPGDKDSIEHVMALLSATLPRALVVAEGVQSAAHAAELLRRYPGISYVQGLYLPEREIFAGEWAVVSS